MDDGSSKSDFSHHRASMDHLLRLAAQLLRASAAAVVLVEGDISRTIAHFGLRFGNTSYRWKRNDVAAENRKTVLYTDLKDTRLASSVKSLMGELKPGTYVRTRLMATDDYSYAMLLFVPELSPPPSKSEIQLLEQIGKTLAGHISEISDYFVKTGSSVTIAASYSEMVSAVDTDTEMRALLDRNLDILAISDVFAQRLGLSKSEIIGKSYYSLDLPTTDTMAILYSRALETGISTPEVELSSSRTGVARSYHVKGTPIRPVDHNHDILDISIIETTDLGARDYNLGELQGMAEASQPNIDAASSFLIESLVRKRSIKSRNGINYLTIRSWRSAIRDYQIKALRAIKRDHNQAFATLAGRECADEIESLVGTTTFRYVVPVPCGHSKPGHCFSFSLAKAIGSALDLPVIDAFTHMDQKGSSHPKTNAKRAPMRLIQNVPGPALLIDDVATSGAHLEEASKMLKALGTESFAMAWISGEGV